MKCLKEKIIATQHDLLMKNFKRLKAITKPTKLNIFSQRL